MSTPWGRLPSPQHTQPLTPDLQPCHRKPKSPFPPSSFPQQQMQPNTLRQQAAPHQAVGPALLNAS